MGRISALTELTSLASNDYIIVLDSSANIAKKITVANAFGIPDIGWTAAGETWSYASATTITVPSNATTKYGVGMLVKITQTTGGTKYGTIMAVASTLLTIAWRGGATLANETISTPYYSSLATPLGAGRIQTNSLSNPYKFSVYRGGTYAVSSTAQKVALDFETFDTNSNFDPSTNYRYTAPVAGFYYISGQIWIGSAGMGTTEWGQANIYKNGSAIKSSEKMNGSGDANRYVKPTVSALVQLAAGDYIELYTSTGGVYRDIVGGSGATWLEGFLVSIE